MLHDLGSGDGNEALQAAEQCLSQWRRLALQLRFRAWNWMFIEFVSFIGVISLLMLDQTNTMSLLQL